MTQLLTCQYGTQNVDQSGEVLICSVVISPKKGTKRRWPYVRKLPCKIMTTERDGPGTMFLEVKIAALML